MISIKISNSFANDSTLDKSQDVAAVQRTSSVPWRRRCVFHYVSVYISMIIITMITIISLCITNHHHTIIITSIASTIKIAPVTRDLMINIIMARHGQARAIL